MFKTKTAMACEIFSAGVCNIDCAYCYIPKVAQMKEVHKEIIAKMESGKFIDELYQAYGDQLTDLGLWGTEPTITLPHVQKMLPALVKRFPKLKGIGWSSNFILPPKVTVDFIQAAIALDHPLKLRMQVSLDGQAAITDVSRKGGATETIVKNVTEFIHIVENIDLKKVTVDFSSKPTWDNVTVNWFMEDRNRLREYYEFYEPLIELSNAARKKNRNFFARLSSGFTIMIPGKYTTQDGKNFGQLLEWAYELEQTGKYQSHGVLNPYETRLVRLLDHDMSISEKPEMFTCSGGKSNFALDEHGKIHICHRSFFLNNAEYVKEATALSGIEKWGVSKFDRGSVNLVNRKFVFDPTDEVEVDRFQYVMGGYHYFFKHKLNYGLAIVHELMRSGQISEAFSDPTLALFFVLYMNTAFSCPMENLLNTGVVHFQVISMFRMLGNGAFETTLKNVLRKRNK